MQKKPPLRKGRWFAVRRDGGIERGLFVSVQDRNVNPFPYTGEPFGVRYFLGIYRISLTEYTVTKALGSVSRM